MKTFSPPSPDYDAITAAAKVYARQLRDEAMNEAWQGVCSASMRGIRALNRYAHALARHTRFRQHTEG